MYLQVIHSISLSAAMACRSISLIISTFEGVLAPRKHSSMLLIKAKFSLAFIHALIVLLGSFLLLAKRSAVCKKKRLHFLLILPKHENTSGVNDPCSTWRIHWLYSVSFRFYYFYEQIIISFDFWCHFFFLQFIRDYLEIEFCYTLLYWLFLWRLLENFHILPYKFLVKLLIPFHRNENSTHSVGLKVYPCNKTLMKVSIASSSGFNTCEILGTVLMKYV